VFGCVDWVVDEGKADRCASARKGEVAVFVAPVSSTFRRFAEEVEADTELLCRWRNTDLFSSTSNALGSGYTHYHRPRKKRRQHLFPWTDSACHVGRRPISIEKRNQHRTYLSHISYAVAA